VKNIHWHIICMSFNLYLKITWTCIFGLIKVIWYQFISLLNSIGQNRFIFTSTNEDCFIKLIHFTYLYLNLVSKVILRDFPRLLIRINVRKCCIVHKLEFLGQILTEKCFSSKTRKKCTPYTGSTWYDALQPRNSVACHVLASRIAVHSLRS
jgi:hypothetical protein